jgi:hypothetical protein
MRIRDEQPGSYFQELRNQFFGLKYLHYLMRIRDPGWKKFGSGIRDKHLESATLLCPCSTYKIYLRRWLPPVHAGGVPGGFEEPGGGSGGGVGTSYGEFHPFQRTGSLS